MNNYILHANRVSGHTSAPWRSFDTLLGHDESYESPTSFPNLQNPQIQCQTHSLYSKTVCSIYVLMFWCFAFQTWFKELLFIRHQAAEEVTSMYVLYRFIQVVVTKHTLGDVLGEVWEICWAHLGEVFGSLVGMLGGLLGSFWSYIGRRLHLFREIRARQNKANEPIQEKHTYLSIRFAICWSIFRPVDLRNRMHM